MGDRVKLILISGREVEMPLEKHDNAKDLMMTLKAENIETLRSPDDSVCVRARRVAAVVEVD